MCSGMVSTGESMQIYGDDNLSFESCQLDLETQATKTSYQNLLSWQACVHRHTHTWIIHNPPWVLRQMAFSHVKGQNWNGWCEHKFGYSSFYGRKGSHQCNCRLKKLLRKFMLYRFSLQIIQGMHSFRQVESLHEKEKFSLAFFQRFSPLSNLESRQVLIFFENLVRLTTSA